MRYYITSPLAGSDPDRMFIPLVDVIAPPTWTPAEGARIPQRRLR